MKSRNPVYLALACQVLISAGTYVLAKLALTSFAGLEVLFLRFALTLPLFVGLLLARPAPRIPPRKQWGTFFLLGLVGLPLNQGFFLVGLERSTPTHAGLMYALSPLVVFLISVALRREKATRLRAAGLALAFAGVAVVLHDRGSGDEARAYLGDALISCGVLSWALYSVLGRPLAAEHGGIRVTCWTAVIGSVASLPLFPVFVHTEHLAAATPASWLALLFLCVFTSFISYLLWYFALARLEASRVAVWSNLQPVMTALLSYFAYGTRISPSFAVGGALALMGVFLTQRE
ncbi:MAG: DMT family transporter [Myxococcales bacterium]